jgi:hypothetical protein
MDKRSLLIVRVGISNSKSTALAALLSIFEGGGNLVLGMSDGDGTRSCLVQAGTEIKTVSPAGSQKERKSYIPAIIPELSTEVLDKVLVDSGDRAEIGKQKIVHRFVHIGFELNSLTGTCPPFIKTQANLEEHKVSYSTEQ